MANKTSRKNSWAEESHALQHEMEKQFDCDVHQGLIWSDEPTVFNPIGVRTSVRFHERPAGEIGYYVQVEPIDYEYDHAIERSGFLSAYRAFEAIEGIVARSAR